MSDLRQVAERVCRLWWECTIPATHGVPVESMGAAMDDLRAALEAQQEATDPTDPGHDVEVLREHVRHLERRVRELAPPARKPMTYKNQPNNETCWALGEACRKAADDPKCGDYIDRGLILLRELEAKGYGIVSLHGDAP